jgi:Na+/melibiose symporter-like transporter
MLAGSLVMGAAFYAIFSPPSGLADQMLMLWLLGFNLLLRTAQSAFTVPYWALGAELTANYDERTALTGVRTACALSGTMATAVLSFVLFFPGSRFEASGYSAMGAALAIVMTATTLLTIIGSWSWPTVGHSRTTRNEHRASFLTEFRAAIRCRSFCVIAVSSGLFFLSAVLNATVAVHYLTYYAGLTDNRSTSIFQASFYVAALAGAALWVWLTRRIEKQQAYTAATFGIAVVMLLAYMAVGDNSLAGKGNLLVLAIGNAIAGLFASAAWILPSSMMADVLDEHEAETGRRSEGTLFGLLSLAVQLGASLAVIVSGVLLDHYAGLVPGTETQSPETARRIGIVYGVVPACLLATAGVLSMFYRLDRARVAAIQQRTRAAGQEQKAGTAAGV